MAISIFFIENLKIKIICIKLNLYWYTSPNKHGKTVLKNEIGKSIRLCTFIDKNKNRGKSKHIEVKNLST